MLEGLVPPEKEAICVLMRKASDLSPEDFQILNDAINDPRWSGANLRAALADRGFRVHKDAIQQHRTKRCACAR